MTFKIEGREQEERRNDAGEVVGCRDTQYGVYVPCSICYLRAEKYIAAIMEVA